MKKSRLTSRREKNRFYTFQWIFIFCLGINNAFADERAGKVELIEGVIWIQGPDQKMRSIEVDQSLYSGDIIITGKNGELQATMADGALLAVRENSKLEIKSYRANGDELDEAFFSLIGGTFRSITGWIGKFNRKNYKIFTPVATIGVRGTDHEPMFIPAPFPGMKALGEPGVYDKVNSGKTVISNKFGETEFTKNQIGFIGLNARKAANRLKTIPEIYKASRHERRIIEKSKNMNRKLETRLLKKQSDQQLKKNKQPAKLLQIPEKRMGFSPNSKIKSKPKSIKPVNSLKESKKLFRDQKSVVKQKQAENVEPGMVKPNTGLPLIPQLIKREKIDRNEKTIPGRLLKKVKPVNVPTTVSSDKVVEKKTTRKDDRKMLIVIPELPGLKTRNKVQKALK